MHAADQMSAGGPYPLRKSPLSIHLPLAISKAMHAADDVSAGGPKSATH